MTTPVFVPQDQTALRDVRLYTAQDPYYYTIDNRPLKDLDANIRAIGVGGSDAARRTAALIALYQSSVNADVYTPAAGSNAVRSSVGLGVSNPASNVVKIAPGSIFEKRLINVGSPDYVLKQALSLKDVQFNVPAPGTAGQSITYTIEGQFVELTTDNMVGSLLPYVDPTNVYIPSTLINGELRLSIIAGATAATGSQQPPTTSSGKFPLYNVTLSDSSNTPVISAHANSPWIKGFDCRVGPVALTANSATVASNNEVMSATFADAVTSGVSLPVHNSLRTINPFKPIKIKLVMASDVASGNVALRVRYKVVKVGDLLTAAYTTTATEFVSIGGTANALQAYTTATAVIPSTAFGSFVNGDWSAVLENLAVIVDRLGADAGDTNTGNLVVTRISLVQ